MTKDSTSDDDRPAGPAPETIDRLARQGRAGAFLGVPIEVTISVGKARPLVSELVELRRDSVLTLDSTRASIIGAMLSATWRRAASLVTRASARASMKALVSRV